MTTFRSLLLPISLIAILVLGIGAVTYPANTAAAQQRIFLMGQAATGLTTIPAPDPFPSDTTIGIDTYKFGGKTLVLIYAWTDVQTNQGGGISGIGTGQAVPLIAYADDGSIDILLTNMFAGTEPSVQVLGPADGIANIASAIPGTATVTGPEAKILLQISYDEIPGTVAPLNEQANLPSGYTLTIHMNKGAQAEVDVPTSPFGTGIGGGEIYTFSLKIMVP